MSSMHSFFNRRFTVLSSPEDEVCVLQVRKGILAYVEEYSEGYEWEVVCYDDGEEETCYGDTEPCLEGVLRSILSHTVEAEPFD